MRKLLYLLRHAQSAEKQAGQSDKVRELTSIGVEHSMRIGNFFINQKKFPEIILCSTANRARATALHVMENSTKSANEIEFSDELYDLSIDSFLRIIHAVESNISTVMVIGHNPILSYLVTFLTGEKFQGMKPAGLSIIDFDIDSWSQVNAETGKLVSYIDPEDL